MANKDQKNRTTKKQAEAVGKGKEGAQGAKGCCKAERPLAYCERENREQFGKLLPAKVFSIGAVLLESVATYRQRSREAAILFETSP